jgi:hypothetical protein
MSNQSDSSIIDIDEDNYTVLITDQGGAFYNNNDKTKAIPFNSKQLKEIVYGRNDLAVGSGLLYPVTRFFNGEFTKFIIERSPQEITLSLNEKTYTYNLPWTYFYFEIDENLLIKKIQIFFRPLNAVTKYDLLYRFPTPFTDDNGVIDQKVIDFFNENVSRKTKDINMKLYNFFDSFFNLFKNKITIEDNDLNETVLPEAFLDNGLETYKDLLKFSKDIPLEKLILLDYRSFNVSTSLDYDESGTPLTFLKIISYINASNNSKYTNFLNLIKQVLNLT